jgi:hypothetical protein
MEVLAAHQPAGEPLGSSGAKHSRRLLPGSLLVVERAGGAGGAADGLHGGAGGKGLLVKAGQLQIQGPACRAVPLAASRARSALTPSVALAPAREPLPPHIAHSATCARGARKRTLEALQGHT